MVVTKPARLGLDLRGGTQIVLEAKDGSGQPVDGDTLARTLEVLRRRVDQLGVAEPTLQRSGDRRVIVELPGVYDPEEATEVIGRTAQLTFHPVLGLADPAAEAGEPTGTTRPAGEDGLVLAGEDGGRLRLGPAALTGEAVGDARAELDPQLQTRWQVAIEFQGDGGRRWAELTGTAACQPAGDPRRRVAIVLDRQVISSPQVDPSVACEQGITGGQTVITGDFTGEEAGELALLVRAGALPVPVEVVEQRTVGPTLGESAIRASVLAAVVGAALTMLYMVAYYRLLGGLASVALLAYGLLSFAVLLAVGSTLTLPGIAGFVLAIGMAVDANVLVFERMREEHRAGARLRSSLERGFTKALSAIADASVTTLLAAGLLFFLASGAVRGFGVTLSVGVLVSLFTALVVTRVLVELVARAAAVRRRPGLLGLDGGGRLAAWLATRGPDLLGRARWWLAGSLVALLLAAAGLVVRGPNLGVEFTGGRLLEYQTERPVDLDAARQALAEAGFPRAVVQASGDGNLTVRTAQLDQAGEERVGEAVTAAAGRVTELRDEFIGPTIGAELRRKALIALGIALVVQLGYLAVRFRWTFGAAAVLAMFHDVAILLGLFAWLGKPLDGVFLAALLTVIGYSVNDSVVVFDRIRERLRGRTREPLDRLANDACLQTIPRTINTGLGALFILAALFVLGGDTLTDFALALLVGILVGTYSSVFVATPLLVAFEGTSGRPPTTTTQPAARRPATTTAPTGARSSAATGGRRASNAQSRSSAPPSGQRRRPAQRSRGRRR
ncbi:MAG TPA: protein translocase subunit SecD [Actinomycetota bacterium]|nr:protein translocase subunit SecD [Actinomycetota bacterium]